MCARSHTDPSRRPSAGRGSAKVEPREGTGHSDAIGRRVALQPHERRHPHIHGLDRGVELRGDPGVAASRLAPGRPTDPDKPDAVSTAQFDASVQAVDVRVAPFVRLQRDAPADGVAVTRPFAGLDVFALPRPALGRLLGSVWLRAHIDQQLDGALQAAQLFAARSLWSGVRVEVGGRRVQGTPGATFHSCRCRAILPAVRTLTLVSAPTVGGTPTASQFRAGVGPVEPIGRAPDLRARPSLERAGLTGRVFLDENGNGRWDPGEAIVPGVRVFVARTTRPSDSSGWFPRVGICLPFEAGAGDCGLRSFRSTRRLLVP